MIPKSHHCGLVADRAAQGELLPARRPELAALLRAAEDLLTGVGHDVELCGNYGDSLLSDTVQEARA